MRSPQVDRAANPPDFRLVTNLPKHLPPMRDEMATARTISTAMTAATTVRRARHPSG